MKSIAAHTKVSRALQSALLFVLLFFIVASPFGVHSVVGSSVNSIEEMTISEEQDLSFGRHNHFVQGTQTLPQPGSPQSFPSPADAEGYQSAGSGSTASNPQKVPSRPSGGKTPDTPQVLITPANLDFGDRPMSIPAVELITVGNMDTHSTLIIHSITTDSPSFHTSFFRPITLDSYSNITIEVVFLPRSTGFVESSLVLHTSMGTFIFQVSGRGIPNPYKLSPLVGVKVPVGVLYEPEIVLHNPYYDILSATEIYTSSGFLRLTLPDSASTFRPTPWQHHSTSLLDTQHLTAELCMSHHSNHSHEGYGSNEPRILKFWDIKPHESKPLIKLQFSSTKTGKFQGFVNIKTNYDNIILQVEVSVVKGSIHRTPEELDFGVVTTMQEHKTVDLTLLNSGTGTVQVSDLTIAQPDPQLVIKFAPVSLPPKKDVVVASVTYHAKLDGVFRGKLLLRTNDSNPAHSRLEIPYKVRVLAGYISYPSSHNTLPSFFNPIDESDSQSSSHGESTVIQTCLADPALLVQELVLTNKFSLPIVVYSAEIDDPRVKLFPIAHSLIAEPGESWPPLKVIVDRSNLSNEHTTNGSDIMFTTHLHLSTNASILSIPLHVYHGKLTYQIPGSSGPHLDDSSFSSSDTQGSIVENQHSSAIKVGKSSFNVAPNVILSFGTVQVNEVHTMSLNVTNHNPIKIPLVGMWTNVEGLSIKLESIWNSQGYRAVANVEFKAKKPSNLGFTGQSPLASLQELFTIPPGYSAMYSLELNATKERMESGYIFVATGLERTAIPVDYHSLAGALTITPTTLVFDKVLSSEVTLYAEHTYSQSITISSITTSDLRIFPIPPQLANSPTAIGSQDEKHLWIRPNTKTPIGTVIFDPLRMMKNQTSKGHRESLVNQINSSKSPSFLGYLSTLLEDTDTIPTSRVNQLSSDRSPNNDYSSWIRAVFTLRTNVNTVTTFPIKGRLTHSSIISATPQSDVLKSHKQSSQDWAGSVVSTSSVGLHGHNNEDSTMKTYDSGKNKYQLYFGILEASSSLHSISHPIPLRNPTPATAAVQLLLGEVSYRYPTATIPSFDEFIDFWFLNKDDAGRKEISLHTPIGNCKGSFSFSSSSSSVKNGLLSSGGEHQFGPVVFSPKFEGICVQPLYVRNNVTVLETILLVGVGGVSDLGFIRPKFLEQSAQSDAASTESNRILIMQDDSELERLQQDALKKRSEDVHTERGTDIIIGFSKSQLSTLCKDDSSTDSSSKKSIVLSRQMEIINKGNVAVRVDGMNIDGGWRRSCSSQGFSIVDCNRSFMLAPNDTKIIELQFTPDFSASRVESELTVTCNSSRTFKFALHGIVPESTLASCSSTFGHKSSSILGQLELRFGLSMALLVCVVLVAVVFWRPMFSPPKLVSKTFDHTASISSEYALPSPAKELDGRGSPPTAPISNAQSSPDRRNSNHRIQSDRTPMTDEIGEVDSSAPVAGSMSRSQPSSPQNRNCSRLLSGQSVETDQITTNKKKDKKDKQKEKQKEKPRKFIQSSESVVASPPSPSSSSPTVKEPSMTSIKKTIEDQAPQTHKTESEKTESIRSASCAASTDHGLSLSSKNRSSSTDYSPGVSHINTAQLPIEIQSPAPKHLSLIAEGPRKRRSVGAADASYLPLVHPSGSISPPSRPADDALPPVGTLQHLPASPKETHTNSKQSQSNSNNNNNNTNKPRFGHKQAPRYIRKDGQADTSASMGPSPSNIPTILSRPSPPQSEPTIYVNPTKTGINYTPVEHQSQLSIPKKLKANIKSESSTRPQWEKTTQEKYQQVKLRVSKDQRLAEESSSHNSKHGKLRDNSSHTHPLSGKSARQFQPKVQDYHPSSPDMADPLFNGSYEPTLGTHHPPHYVKYVKSGPGSIQPLVGETMRSHAMQHDSHSLPIQQFHERSSPQLFASNPTHSPFSDDLSSSSQSFGDIFGISSDRYGTGTLHSNSTSKETDPRCQPGTSLLQQTTMPYPSSNSINAGLTPSTTFSGSLSQFDFSMAPSFDQPLRSGDYVHSFYHSNEPLSGTVENIFSPFKEQSNQSIGSTVGNNSSESTFSSQSFLGYSSIQPGDSSLWNSPPYADPSVLPNTSSLYLLGVPLDGDSRSEFHNTFTIPPIGSQSSSPSLVGELTPRSLSLSGQLYSHRLSPATTRKLDQLVNLVTDESPHQHKQ